MEILDVKFDRFALVGNLYLEAEEDLQFFLNRTDSKIKSVGNSRVVAQLYADNVFLEYDLLQGKKFKKGNFRIDYNPSKLTHEMQRDLVSSIKPLLHDLHFTRIDIAFDCDFDLSQYRHEHVNPLDWATYGGKTGAVQTLYYGSRNSDFYSRTYNKKLQLKDVMDIEYKELEHWWRYELEIKNKNACQSMIDLDFPIFERVRFKGYGYEEMTGTDRIIVEGLVKKPELMGILSQYERAKYRKILASMKAKDLTPMFEDKLKNKLPQLKRELRAWQPIPKFTDIVNQRWL